MVEPRGLWLQVRAIERHWESSKLNEAFHAYWPDSNAKHPPVLHYGDIEPRTPGPHCVFEVAAPVVLSQRTGHTVEQVTQTLSIEIQFRVHAKSTPKNEGKEICSKLATAIRKAFDDPARLDVSPDTHLGTTRAAAFHAQEGDNEWAWVVPFTLLMEVTYRI